MLECSASSCILHPTLFNAFIFLSAFDPGETQSEEAVQGLTLLKVVLYEGCTQLF